MRIGIREQLTAIVILAVCVALATISIPTWVYVHSFVVGVEADGLALTASLKASTIISEINMIQTISQTVASRVLLQQAMVDFYNGNSSTSDPFTIARADLASAMSTSRKTGLLQARLYSRNSTGDPHGLLNVTGNGIGDQVIVLPGRLPDGGLVTLGGGSKQGFPAPLYPNLTYESLGYANPYVPSTPAFVANAFPGVRLNDNGGLLLGPLVVNQSFALISLTIPISSLNISNFILGYMTLIASVSSFVDVEASREGLSDTGVVLLVGPSSNPSNRFSQSLPPSNATYSPPRDAFARSPVHLVLPPPHLERRPDRRDMGPSFPLAQYPALLDLYYNKNPQPNNATAFLSTKNEQGSAVAVGVARPQSTLVDWAVVIEKTQDEAYQPIQTLRSILLGCVFSTACLIICLIVPCAHLSVRPIHRLKSATEQSTCPPGYDELEPHFDDGTPSSGGGALSQRSKKGFLGSIRRRVASNRRSMNAAEPHRVFKIPGKVPVQKHRITDELTELTQTFNDMSDELLKQYTVLDQKVAERTSELEISKKAAEAANESKTLFIANLSHELKTPLNGIMGMAAICMEEDDIGRIRKSLKTLYKSGDLLLHLLEDLLSFSKNQIGQHLSLEEKMFRLGDIKTQVVSIFDKQVRENRIAFTTVFQVGDVYDSTAPSSEQQFWERRLANGWPPPPGRIKDMCLWGDVQRLLQIIINLVSNSLKFTPPEGRVELRIRCAGELDRQRDSKTSSLTSRAARNRQRASASTTRSMSPRGMQRTHMTERGTALEINPAESKTLPYVSVGERSPTPPPPNAKTFLFEFEVEDTGRGIPEHMLEKIFEPFVQGDLGLSKKFGGTGLGLAICAQLAGLMGGSISVKSTLGVGSTFSIFIPLKYVADRPSSTASSSVRGSITGDEFPRSSLELKTNSNNATATNNIIISNNNSNSNNQSVLEDEQPRLVGLSAPFFAANPNSLPPPPTTAKEQTAILDKALSKKNPEHGRLRVMVADDNSTNVEVVSRMLKLEDVYDVTIAKDGQEAYDLVKANMEKEQDFDVIFMDVQMPNLDGLQSTRLIRQMGYAAPIVALTAFSEESNIRECRESGMNDFISKPIRRPALKKVLAAILEEVETGKSPVAR
ncbi:hypothetical protein L249_1460 [Ophiocordyceps polyrhachis-furcata BCC 54312]|uniref:histidine kinase n=1 Tax=Ophiocordyceps polyrhachis-furcata BCC 54312 TaxID=1330021 RepID=A0A367L453_9HYPO|nr:hypothetical protein L249_1460 [Ophiocordyceps polyrhachis-furcata BCC 54312]